MDRDVIRKYALRLASPTCCWPRPRNPAMLQYLNLAAVDQERDQRELRPRAAGTAHRRPRRHYTEADVQNSAKILTGRTLDADFNYVYNPDQALGRPDHGAGLQPRQQHRGRRRGGRRCLPALPGQPPGTANRLAQKLCVRFVSDTPSPTPGGRGGHGLPGQRHPDHADAERPSCARRSSGPAAAPRSAGRPRTCSPPSGRSASQPGDLAKSMQILHWMSSAGRPGAAGLVGAQRLPGRGQRLALVRLAAQPVGLPPRAWPRTGGARVRQARPGLASTARPAGHQRRGDRPRCAAG